MNKKIYNEQTLREEIIKVWGKVGWHIDVYDMLLKAAKKK
jgi:hypothetical protein